MPQTVSRALAGRARAEPVLAVLVCHDGEPWLREVLSALRGIAPRPRHVIAVDTGSRDRTPVLLAEAAEGDQPVLDGVLTLNRYTGFGAAVAAAVDVAVARWGDPGRWIWLLHDDSAPDPDCLGVLLRTAELSASAGLLGPLALDWADPRLVVEVGLSTDASGHRQTGIGPTEPDWSRSRPSGDDNPDAVTHDFEQSTEALAVSSAGALIRRDLWHELDGYDTALPLLRDDLDFGWRVNRAGGLVLCVPAARLRHARALTRGLRPPDAERGRSVRAVDRSHGLRTFLVNTSTLGFVIGLPRLVLLCLLRAIGFTLLRRLSDARAELSAIGYLCSGKAKLHAARAKRVGGQRVHGLLTSRTTRLRNAFRGGMASLVRRRVAADAALGRLPDSAARSAWVDPDEQRRLVGPAALPAGALGRQPRHRAGLRRPATAVAVSLAEPAESPRPRRRPSPMPRDGSGATRPDLMLIEVARGRLLLQLLLAPPVLLFLGLVVVSVLTNAHRLGIHLSGGALLPAQGVAATWSDYLASWHAVAGGTAQPAPATLAVIGALGTVLYPIGGPPTAVALLLLGDAPIAGVLAYVATRRLPVRRWIRALVAAGYALLPAATAAVAQGRLDAVVVHILLPPVLAGTIAVWTPSASRWLSSAAVTAIGLAVIGAFAPLVHGMMIIVALIGFVVVPGGAGDGRRRVAALFIVVLLPLALLLPWPAVVLTHPAVLLTGVAGAQPSGAVDLTGLVALDPGGPGGGWTGIVVLVAVAVAIVLRPRRAVLPGIAVAVFGAVAVGLVATMSVTAFAGPGPQRFWTGAPMMMVGCGLLWALLATCRDTGPKPARSDRLLALLGGVAVLGLAVGSVLAAAGPLTDDAPTLAAPLTAELTQTGRSTLVLAADGQPTRSAGGRLPAFGDDDIPRVPGSERRLIGWSADLLSGDRDRTRTAIADAATSGVLFLVLPDRASAQRFAHAAGGLASGLPPTSDGHPVERLQPASGAVTLISPELAHEAVTGGHPPTKLGAVGIAPVDAAPPDVAAHVSDGPPGRLLVLAAEYENGWQATVDGATVGTVRAWGHLVAVTVPLDGADVRVFVSASLRDALLLVQAAALLFAALTAIPGRR